MSTGKSGWLTENSGVREGSASNGFRCVIQLCIPGAGTSTCHVLWRQSSKALLLPLNQRSHQQGRWKKPFTSRDVATVLLCSKNHGLHGKYRNRDHLLCCEEVVLWYSRTLPLILVLRSAILWLINTPFLTQLHSDLCNTCPVQDWFCKDLPLHTQHF